jgi:hypothetical protein
MRFPLAVILTIVCAGWAASSPGIDTTRCGTAPGCQEPSGATIVRPFQPKSRPANSTLLQNDPNPALTSTVIWYFVKEIGPVSLKLYDAKWREVGYFAVPGNRQSSGNWYEVHFSVKILRSGHYFYRLRTSGYSETRVMTVVR